MHIWRNNPKHVYSMNGVQLVETTEERDIRVTVSCNLKPGQQCRKAAQTASVVLGQITRAFHYRDRGVFLNLYKQYVRPHLEFSVAAWAPTLGRAPEPMRAAPRDRHGPDLQNGE